MSHKSRNKRDMEAVNSVPCPVCRVPRGASCKEQGANMMRGGHPTVHTARRFDARAQRDQLCNECGAKPDAPCDAPHGYVHAARRRQQEVQELAMKGNQHGV